MKRPKPLFKKGEVVRLRHELAFEKNFFVGRKKSFKIASNRHGKILGLRWLAGSYYYYIEFPKCKRSSLREIEIREELIFKPDFKKFIERLKR